MQGRYLTAPGGWVLRLRVKDSPPSRLYGQTTPPKPISVFWEEAVKRPKDSNAYSLALKQNIYSYILTTQTKGFYVPRNPRLQRRLSHCSEPNPAIEMHVGTDLKCGHFLKTKSLTVAPGCKFVLKPFICHHWIIRTKSTKILVSHCPESWHLRGNSSHTSYLKQEFFLEHCQTITAWPFPMTEISFFIKKKYMYTLDGFSFTIDICLTLISTHWS